MSSFFTRPASQKKRKRADGEARTKTKSPKFSKSKQRRDDSISGSDSSDDDDRNQRSTRDDAYDDSSSEEDEFADEDAASKRIRLAEQYLANTQKEVLEEVGFDAADVDAENLRRRMGDRLKEDTAETKGKLYRWIAQEFDWSKSERAQFRHHQKCVTAVAISGEFAYTVGKDKILVKWQLPSTVAQPATIGVQRSRKPKKLIVSRPFGQKVRKNEEAHTAAILCVAASQDGKFVATGGADRKLIVWDAATLKPLRTFTQHRDNVTSLAFRRGTNQLFSASKDRTVKIWSLNELTYVETLFGHQDEVVDVGALAQETCVTVGARDRTARFWKIVEESQLVFRGGGAPGKADPTQRQHHEGSMDRIACIDEETFITGSDNGALSLWNIHKKKAVFTHPLAHGLDPPLPLDEASAEEKPDEAALGKPQPRWITALRSIPFSDCFVSGSWDGYLRVWKVSSDKRTFEFLGTLGSAGTEFTKLLNGEASGSESLSVGTLLALQADDERPGRINGFVNDIAIADRGKRAEDGIAIIAAVGKEPRLGRWTEISGASNVCVLFEVSRKRMDSTDSTLSGTHIEALDGTGDDAFAGFD